MAKSNGNENDQYVTEQKKSFFNMKKFRVICLEKENLTDLLRPI